MAAPLSPTSLRTAADLAYEPDDGLRRELHDGVVLVVPPSNEDHSWEVRAADRGCFATDLIRPPGPMPLTVNSHPGKGPSSSNHGH